MARDLILQLLLTLGLTGFTTLVIWAGTTGIRPHRWDKVFGRLMAAHVLSAAAILLCAVWS